MKEEDKERKSSQAWKLLVSFIGIYTTVSVGILGWCAKEIAGVTTRVTILERTAYTATDASALLEKLSRIESTIAAMPKETPPSWLINRIDKLEARLEDCRER